MVNIIEALHLSLADMIPLAKTNTINLFLMVKYSLSTVQTCWKA